MSTQDKKGQTSVNEAGSKGGQHSGGNFKNDPQRAAEAGSKGGQHSGGNFANDREKASQAGRKGGEHSHGGGRSS
ncbi:stress-induced protein [Pseudomonas rhodesiae]|uniref:Stress-induced acidophilic repeat motif-containing protein n=1 Tax=Pseudomonas rhodesiae TaxID=76760 RepID=A0AAE8HCW9_9PSED|nr:general stress protein [Pseudomonas sp. EKM23D]NMZ20567.1 general stress protein [Pseudomonas rhodesiae]OXS20201.1 stress-induced protein [Pseudomonas fluorescens]POA60285.1 stress-induced protein [Pseudomonas sp. GW531-R1]OZO47547.1 stress-induced protein [Pseudomonas fluorescens]